MKLFIICLTIFTFAQIAFAKSNPYKCTKDDDCIKTYHGCGRYESVNKEYSKRVSKMTRQQDKKEFCNKPTREEVDFYRKALSVCEKKECKLVPPKEA